MYDFIDFSQGANFYMNLYCLLLYCTLLIISLRGNIVGFISQDSYRERTWMLAAGLLLFALTCFVSADFFHYYGNMAMFKNQAYVDPNANMEAFYQRLIYYVNGDYFLFRLVVWGIGLMLIILAACQFGANVYHTLFVVLAGFVLTYSYARATLAIATFSMGAVMICMAVTKKRKLISLIVGVCVVASAICFHRSLLPMLAIVLFWILLPWKKKLSKYSLWLFPLFVALFYVVVKVAFEELLTISNTMEDDSVALDKVEFYSEQEVAKSNMNGYIRLALQYSTFYLPMFILSRVLSSEKVLQMVDKKVVWLYLITFLIFAFATSFLFLDIDSSVLFYRYLFMSFILLSILIVYLNDKGMLTTKQYHCMMACFIIYNLFQFSAVVYSQI